MAIEPVLFVLFIIILQSYIIYCCLVYLFKRDREREEIIKKIAKETEKIVEDAKRKVDAMTVGK
jgi:hypothetical protein